MPKIVGVRFRNAAKSYYFDPKDFELGIGEKVVVDTAKGMEIGEITIPPTDVPEEKIKPPLKPVLRKANDEDKERLENNIREEKEAFIICKDKISDHELPMKLIAAEYSFDRSKLLFYFSAEGRVDFRLLVKDLAGVFRTRIELRQVGVRDETKILGGIGICGRELCCKTFLRDFNPVSIKMAKVQNLSLNPGKISGVCGRLMCCLNNEQETYEYLNKTLPNVGDFATDIDGKVGVIRGVNILKGSVVVMFEENDTREIKEFPAADVGITKKKDGRPAPGENIPENADEIRERLEAEKMKAISGLSEWDVSSDSLTHTGTSSSDKSDKSQKQDKSKNKRRNNNKKKGRGKPSNSKDKRNTNSNSNSNSNNNNKKSGNSQENKESRRGGGNRGNQGTPNKKKGGRNQNRNQGQNQNQNKNQQNQSQKQGQNQNQPQKQGPKQNQKQSQKGRRKDNKDNNRRNKPKNKKRENDIRSNNTGGYTSNYGRRRDEE